MTRILLTEYVDCRIELTQSDIALLHGQLNKHVDVRPSFDGNAYIVNPGSTVGVVRLPSGAQLELRPKVPLRNLLWMLSYVYDVPHHLLNVPVEITRFDQVIEIVADVFSRMVERRIDLGLYRNYVEENLSTVRGRIMIAADIHRNAFLRHRTYCRYTTFSWDLPENQVIRQVVHLLSGWGLSRRLTGRLLTLDSQLEEIERVQFRATDIYRFIYNRQSMDYKPIHRLCQLFLEGASLSEEGGDTSFDGFLLDMNVLFERFVTRALMERLESLLRLDVQLWMGLDRENSVQMRPDLVISRDGTHMLVADCKYKRLLSGEHKHHDLYQLLAYCTAMDIREGILIYPRHLVDVATQITVRGADVKLRELTVDLGGSTSEIICELDILADRIRQSCPNEAQPDFGISALASGEVPVGRF
jgi:5-methylcytosine-specific restriction enzyme subunit McrC